MWVENIRAEDMHLLFVINNFWKFNHLNKLPLAIPDDLNFPSEIFPLQNSAGSPLQSASFESTRFCFGRFRALKYRFFTSDFTLEVTRKLRRARTARNPTRECCDLSITPSQKNRNGLKNCPGEVSRDLLVERFTQNLTNTFFVDPC